MNSFCSAWASASVFWVAWASLMTFSSQPESWLARRTFWPPRPMALDRLSSATAMSMLLDSSSMVMDCTSAGDMALMTNCAGLSSTGHDVHALAGEFVGHGLHARTAHADAGADRVDARVMAHDRHLGAGTRIAGRALDLDEALAHFRHFQLEQLDEELRRGTGHEQLRAAGLGAHFLQVTADAVAGAHRLARDHVLAGDEGLGVVAKVDVDVAALHALDETGDQLTDAALVGFHYLRTLGLAHFLHDDLLGGLGADAAEGHGLPWALR